MTQYFPGPYELELFYTEATLTHKMRLNLDLAVEGLPGEPFAAFSVRNKSMAAVTMNTATDAWVTLIKPLFASTTNFTIANLYKFVPDSFEKIFLSTYDVNQIGTGAGAAQLSQQLTYTFTTQLGNGIKLVLLEGNTASNVRVPIRDTGAQFQAVANFMTGATNWIMARDGSFPAGKLNLTGGQNEAVFKRRNR